MNKQLKVLYGLLMMIFWMTDASICIFSSAYLIYKGFTNTQIGIVLGLAGLLSVIAQPVIANVLDQTKKYNVMQATIAILSIAIVLLIILFFVDTPPLVTQFFYTVVYSITLTTIPLISSVFFVVKNINQDMNFGLYRAFGCVGYSLSSFVCGRMISKFGANIIPIQGTIICLLCVIILFFINHLIKKENIGIEETNIIEEKISFKDFILNRKDFLLINITIAMFCVVNKIMSSYLLQIITPLNGTTADQGNMSTMWAFLEMIPMFFFSFISDRFSYRDIIMVSAFASVAKAFGLYAANSLGGIYAALSFQMLSQGLFNPCIVLFLNSCVTKKEAVRAQSLHTTLLSVDTIAMSLIGGFVIDNFGVKKLTFGCFIVVLAGAILFTILTRKKRTI